MNESVKLIECPRDAMQGWPHLIPTEKKINYINNLLQIGFDTIDVASFVSPKAVPQMADSKEVIRNLVLPEAGKASTAKLLAIIANERGAQEAAEFDEITYLGFPFSISQTFQLRNTNSTIEESVRRIEKIIALCDQKKKQLVIYLSMAFGNPYNDEYSEEVLLHWADEMVNNGIKIISLADTVGLASPQQISFACQALIPKYPQVEFGVHLHSSFQNRKEKLEAALEAGCMRFDGALRGIGGCPMAQDDLVGNMDTVFMIEYFKEKNLLNNLNEDALEKGLHIASEIFV
jgi:hydroxymethylglutaryl-CoA lyase